MPLIQNSWFRRWRYRYVHVRYRNNDPVGRPNFSNRVVQPPNKLTSIYLAPINGCGPHIRAVAMWGSLSNQETTSVCMAPIASRAVGNLELGCS